MCPGPLLARVLAGISIFGWGAILVKPKTATAEKPDAKPVPEPKGGGFGAFFVRQFEKMRGTRPDHSVEGFLAAIDAAAAYCGKRDWNTAQDMEEEFEMQMCATLRTPPGSVSVEFVARHRETKQPRMLILTSWGLREAFEGPISFNLHFKPDRALRPVK